MSKARICALSLAALLLAAIPARAEIVAVASFSILADLTRVVGGEAVRVEVLVGPETDAHGFQPGPAEARKLAQARVVIVNGLGFDPWVERLVKASGAKPRVIVASAGIAPRQGGHHGADPHAWQDPALAARYVATIAEGLAALDPAGAAGHRARAEDYAKRLESLAAEYRAAIAAIPSERRRIVTSHDAFGYLGQAFGLRVLALKGLSSESEPSAQAMARLIRAVRAEGVRVVLVESPAETRLAERLARETGARLGPRLYADTLSRPDGPAPDFLAMLRHNLSVMVAAMNAVD